MGNIVITFHDVHDAAWFENTITYLNSNYTFISSKELIDYYYNNKKLKNSCLITVDDGALSSYEVIYPILKRYRIPAVFFVSPEIAKREHAINFWFQEIGNCDKGKLVRIAQEHFNRPNITEKDVDELIHSSAIDDIWGIILKYQELYSISAREPHNMTIQQIVQIDKEGLVEIGAHTMYHPFLARETNLRAKE